MKTFHFNGESKIGRLLPGMEHVLPWPDLGNYPPRTFQKLVLQRAKRMGLHITTRKTHDGLMVWRLT